VVRKIENFDVKHRVCYWDVGGILKTLAGFGYLNCSKLASKSVFSCFFCWIKGGSVAPATVWLT
jgi:hypothetical protein